MEAVIWVCIVADTCRDMGNKTAGKIVRIRTSKRNPRLLPDKSKHNRRGCRSIITRCTKTNLPMLTGEAAR